MILYRKLSNIDYDLFQEKLFAFYNLEIFPSGYFNKLLTDLLNLCASRNILEIVYRSNTPRFNSSLSIKQSYIKTEKMYSQKIS